MLNSGNCVELAFPTSLLDSAAVQNDLLNQLNSTVNTLLAAKNKGSIGSADVKYLWDLLPNQYKVMLLNQTQLLSQTQKLLKKVNSKKLSWSALPKKVKSFLLNQAQNGSIFSVTYKQWGWDSSKYANETLASLLPPELKQALPKVGQILNNVKYSDIINPALLKNSNLVDVNNILQQSIDQLLKTNLRMIDGRQRKARDPFDIYNEALLRADSFLNSKK